MEVEDIEVSNKQIPPADVEFWKQFVTSAPTAISMINKNSYFVAVSERFKACYGLDEHPVAGHHLDELFADMPDRWRLVLLRTMSGESLKCEKDLFQRADGSMHWLRWESLPYRHTDGIVGGCLIFIEMITNEISAERNLQFVLESSAIGVWERDLLHNKLRMTEESERLLGYVPGTMGNDPRLFDSCVHPEDSVTVSSAVEAAMLTRRASKLKFRVIWPNGSIHWLYSLCECEFSLDGAPARLRGVSIDITESQQLESDLKALTANLERKVEERTQELQFATEAKSRFLANMSHEIRNPLNTVTLLSKLLEQESLDQKRRIDIAHRISRSTQTVTQILDEILDFSKMEAGQTILEIVPFSLTDLLDEIRESFEAKAEEKGIEIEFLPVECGCLLLGDRHRIKQILSNLVGNAVKFTATGRVSVKTIHEQRSRGTLEVAFDVTDTGIGIASDVLLTLFKPFTQGDSSITRKYGGTGLGLSISKSLADLMGGKIEVSSTLGLGSCFRFLVNLPIDKNCAQKDEAKVLLDTKSCLKGLTILVVDDDPSNIETMCDLLKSMGATTDFVCDGLQALERLQNVANSFDAILMDIQMPIMDGIEASKRIRNELHLERLPIIAVTAGVLPHQQQEAISVGITELIRKPVDHQLLVDALLRHSPRPDC